MDATPSPGTFHGAITTKQIFGRFCLDHDGRCHQVFHLSESRSLRALAVFITGRQHIRRRHADDEGLAEPCLR